MATTFRDRMLEFEPECFGSSADEVLRFVASTRPTPSAEDIEAHIRWLDREGLISAVDLVALRAAGYRV